jgi:ATP phosphoribosyltransferase regulatory subunit
MARDLVALEARVRVQGLPHALFEVPGLRGGPEVLDRAEEAMGEVAATALIELRGLYEALSERGFAERLILDLGLVHELGYYTGAVFEVYDPAVGFALGGGGRYDQLIGRFGKPRPACGVALDVQRVHMAQAAEEKMR